jgi:Nuclear cap-binding protein subunit 3
VPHKVHIRGLDTFNPEEVKAYLAEHFSATQLDRIEWIDDSSANLVFKTESTAQDALISLAAVEVADPTQLLPLEAVRAKGFAPKPDCVLQVRFAVTGDKKVTGAAARSRFYLLHPEFDPEERRRRGEFGRGKYRDRDDGYRRGGDRRSGGRRDRQEDDNPEPFDVSLYDDDPEADSRASVWEKLLFPVS